MVLYKKEKATLSEPLVLPSEFGVDTKVFVIRETGEWFPKYQDYIKRLWFYMQNNFTCEITSHTNLTFFQAMASEEEEFNRLETRFPIKIRAPMAEFLHFNPISRFDLLLEETYFKFKKLFFVDEAIFLKDMNITDANGNVINNISDNIFVTEFLKNHNMYFDREAAESFQMMNGADDNTTEIGVDLSNKWEIKEILDMGPEMPQKYRIYQPSSFIFIEVTAEEIRRERKSYTRHLVRSFMKLTLEKASRKNGSPWRVKEDYIQHYDLSPEWPVQFLKYKELPKAVRSNADTSEGLPPKKRGRPKSNNATVENDEKSGKKKPKSAKKEMLNDEFNTSKLPILPSDEALLNDKTNSNITYNNSDAEIRRSANNSSTKLTPEQSLPPQKQKVVFNPNVLKPKLAIVNDDEIPRVINKFIDIIPQQEALETIRHMAVKSLKEHDKSSKLKSDEELYALFGTLFFYGEAKTYQKLLEPSILQRGFKQYDENFTIKKFCNGKKARKQFDFFLILKIYIFMISFNEVLCLEVPTFQNFLVLLNNENQNKFSEQFSNKVAFEFVNKINDDKTGLLMDLKSQMNEKLFSAIPLLDFITVDEDKKEEHNTFTEGALEFNKFSIELICCLLRLFINEKGDWSVEIPNKWYSFDLKKDIEKEEAISIIFNDKESEFLATCSKYKDVSFSERLMKRNFGNGNWCLILLGIFEDSLHVLPLQDKMKDIIKKFIGDESIFGNKALNTKLLANFAENFKMNDRLNIIYVLMEIVTNYSIEIKQEVDKLSDYTTFLKSERFKTVRSVKTLIKEKNSLTAEKQKMQSSINGEESKESGEILKDLDDKLELVGKQITCKEQVREFWESQVRWAVQLRSKSLGSDRYGNTYWFLESYGSFDLNTLGELSGDELKRSGKIFVQGPKKNEIPMYYNGISYEEYLQKIEKYTTFDDGSILNDESMLILLKDRVWNNNYTNKDLTVLDWKFIDYGANFLVSDEDWGFIDNDDSLKELLNWLYKFGSSERHVKSNITSILESYNKEQLNNCFLYNEEVEGEENQELLKKIMGIYNTLENTDIEILKKLGEQKENYELWNTIIKEAIPTGNDDFGTNLLDALNQNFSDVSEELEKTKRSASNLNLVTSKSSKQEIEFGELSKNIEALTTQKQAIIEEIERNEEQIRRESTEAQALLQQAANDGKLPDIFKESQILKKISEITHLINKILQNNSEKNLKEIKTSYTNKTAVRYFKKNLQSGIAEVKNTKKGKKKTSPVFTVSTLSEKMDIIKDELNTFVSKKGFEEFI